MAEPVHRRASWNDLQQTPEGDGCVYEILDGELEASPRPLPRHGHVQAHLAGALTGPYGAGKGGPGGWWLIVEPEVELGSGGGLGRRGFTYVASLASASSARLPSPDASSNNLP